MIIKKDDLTGSDIIALLNEHLQDMYLTSPPESVHALDLDGLRQPDVTFWSIWQDDRLAGCVALKMLDSEHAEIKSMRSATAFRGQGVGVRLMQHLLQEAVKQNYKKLSLETGSMAYFEPARKLYEKYGFVYCAPFADYREDPNSVFMTKTL
ncbi:GNAT family N-acetyltransferase [Chromatiaceae bacterium AAb-1]|nr:GNAT family N-acetyltransferase [Chromatiaceae bacterium AAb-1]